MDSGVLFGSHEQIEARVRETAKVAKDMGVRHVMNLGHGIMQVCPLGAAFMLSRRTGRLAGQPRAGRLDD